MCKGYRVHEDLPGNFEPLAKAARMVLYGLEMKVRPISAPTLPGFPEKDRMPKHPAELGGRNAKLANIRGGFRSANSGCARMRE
jgi:hypothetical protein